MQISLARRGMVDFDASAFSTKEERDMLYAISKLDVSYNRMTLVKGMHCLSNLTALDISHNNVKSLMHLPLKLRRLDASHNELQYLDGLTPLSQLEWINVSHNAIVSLTGLPGTASLRHVDVSHNRLANVKGIELCSGLHELHMSHNLVRKVEDLVPLRYVRSIKVLSIHENPVTSNARNFTAIRLLVPNVQAIEGAGPAHVDASTLAATQASMNLSHAGGGSGGAPLTAYGQHYHQLRSRTPPQNPNASSSRHSSPNASSIVGQGSGYLSSAPSSRPTSPQRGGATTPRGSHHQKAPTSAAGVRNATTTNSSMGGGSGAAAQPRVSLTGGGSQPQAQQHPSVYQSLLKGLSVNGNVHSSSTAAGGRSRSADASLSSAAAPYHHNKPSSSNSSSTQQAYQKPRPASPNGSTTGRSSTPPYQQQQQQPRHHYSNSNNNQTNNTNNNSSSGNPHNNSSTYRSDQGKDLVDTSVASFATHRMQDEKIRQLEKDLAKSSQQAEEYKRESENLALQVKQLKETIERQAKVNAMLADTNRQLSIEAARLQIGSPAISGSAAASLSVPHNKTAAKPRLSVTGLPPAAQHPQEDSSRLSAAAADEDQSEEDQAADSHEAAFSSRAAALAISDEDYAALLRSSIASTSPTKPSSKRLSTTSSAGANEALSPKPSGLQVSRSSIGNAAREPQERGPTSPQRASISGGGKRLRRSDMSPKRGSMTSDVRELAPQASAVPAYMVASRPASRVGGRSIVASAPATPKGHGNLSTHSVKNVSFGGSQFYSPPQNYNDF